MNAPVLLAQLSGSVQTPSSEPKTLKIEKPANGLALNFHLDGNTRLDLSDIASEKLTFVKVGEKLIVLFDNQSTVTVDPVFDSATGNPLTDVGFQVDGDRVLNGEQFAALFPISTDQSILPAAGNSGPAGGADFHDAQVGALGPGGTPLALLGDETFGNQQFGTTETGFAGITFGAATVGNVDDEGLSDGLVGGPNDAPGNATSVTGSLNINFGSVGVSGASLAFLAGQPGLVGLTSGGETIHLLISNPAGGTPTIVGFVGSDPDAAGSHVFEISLNLSTSTGEYTFTLLRPLDHSGANTEDTLNLTISYSASNASGTVTSAFGVNVNDDSPETNPNGFDQPLTTQGSEGSEGSEGGVIVPHADLKDPDGGTSVRGGTLGILWGADHFNAHENGGISETTGQTGDRSLVFTNATVELSNGDSSLTNSLFSHGEQVHFQLSNDGTRLIGFTGGGDEGPNEGNIVFTVDLRDTDNGGYVFTQYQELDHVGTSGEQQQINLASLDLTFHYTATDSDGDSVAGSFSVTVSDDAPTINVEGIENGQVAEDRFDNGNPGDTYGTNQGAESLTFNGDLGVSWGADDNNSGSLANRSLAFNGVSEGGEVKAQDGTPITSNDQAVHYHLVTVGDQSVLIGYTGAAPEDDQSNWIFKVELDDTSDTGSYTFTLLQPIDQPVIDSEDDVTIDFGFTATDADGDIANGSFSVAINDDAPASSGTVEARTVDEGDIKTLWSTGSSPNDGPGDGSDTGGPLASFLSGLFGFALGGPAYLSGTVATTVAFGADGAHAGGGFGFAADAAATMEALGLTSKGQTVHYAMIGNTLVGYVDQPIFDRPVLALTLKSDGSYEFRQFDQLDHVSGGEHNLALVSNGGSIDAIDFGALITATDGDGDHISLAGKFTIEIQDDVPLATITANGAVTLDETGGNSNGDNTTSSSVRHLFDSVAGYAGHDPDMAGPIYARDGLISTTAAGADESNARTLSLHIDALDSGLTTTDGHSIYLYQISDTLVVGRVDGETGEAAFAITIDQSGRVSVAQYLSLHHNDDSTSNESVDLTGKLSAVVTVTDHDGDTVTQATDIGDNIQFRDDGPKLVGTVEARTVDEGDIKTLWSTGSSPNDGAGDGSDTGGPLASFLSGLFGFALGGPAYLSGTVATTVAFGADGAHAGGGFGFAADAAATMEALGLTSKGQTVHYAMIGNTLVGYVDQPIFDRPVLALTLKSDGSYEFRQFDQLDHVSGGEHNLALVSNGGSIDAIDFGALITATDGDGDHISLAGKFTIEIQDDVPLATITANGAVTLDETGGNSNGDNTTSSSVKNLFHDVDNRGSDSDMSGPIYARDGLISTTAAGADESNARTLSLHIDALDSGLTTTDGHSIYLYQISDTLVVGRVDGETGEAAFAVTIDQSGRVSVAQYLSLHHNDDTTSNDSVDLTGKLSAVVTVTDHDGDTVTQATDIGDNIQFRDDGPKLVGTVTSGLTLNEDDLPTGNDSTKDALSTNGNLNIDLGSDGGNVVLSAEGASWNSATHTLTASDGAWTVTLNSNGTYTFTLLDNTLLHGPANDGTNTLSVPVTYTATDGDGDMIAGSFTVKIVDDAPAATLSKLTVQETANADGSFHEQTTTDHFHFSPGADGAKVTAIHYDFGTNIADGDAMPFTSLALTSGGEQVIVTESADHLTLTGALADGTLVFEIKVTNPATGEYSFTQSAPIDHPDINESGAQDPLRMRISFTVTDGDGDTATNHIQLDVRDDTPTASLSKMVVQETADADGSFHQQTTTDHFHFSQGADGAKVTAIHYDLGTNIADGDATPFTSLALTSGGEQVVVTESADHLTLTGTLADGTPVFVITVTNPATGAYSFTQSAPIDHPDINESGVQDPLRMRISFTVTDNDGDTATNHIQLDVRDDTPTASLSKMVVQETADADGSFHQQTTTDHFHFSQGADGAKVTAIHYDLGTNIADGDATPFTSLALTSGGEQVIVTESADHLTLTGALADGTPVFEIKVTNPATGAYSFTQSAPIDHPDINESGAQDPLRMRISFTVTDGDGDTATNHIQLDINDDAPTATNFTAEMFENQTVTLDLVGHYAYGADGANDADGTVLGTAYVSGLPDGVVLGLPSITLNPDGHTVTIQPGWALDGLSQDQQATLHIPFTVTDGDGDIVTREILVTVTGTNDGLGTSEGTPDGGTMTEYAESDPHAGSTDDRTIFDATPGYGGYNGGTFHLYDPDQSDTHTIVSAEPYPASSTYIGHVTASVTQETIGDGAGVVSWQYHVTDAALNPLSAGEHKTETFRITVQDNHGETTYRDVTIELVGTNDSPIITVGNGDSAYQMIDETNAGLSAQGTLTVTDVDTLDTVHATVLSVSAGGSGIEHLYDNATLLSMLTVASDPVLDSNGARTDALTWTFDSHGEAFNFLPNGWESTLDYTIQVSDGHGGFDTQVVQIKLHGSNDAPVITSGALGSVTEAGDLPPVDEAGLGGTLTVAAALLTLNVTNALATLENHPSDLHNVLTTVQAEQGGDLATAIATAWQHLNDAYVTAAPTDVPAINEAFTRLGVEYATYLKNGGMPLVDVIGKYTADADLSGAPDRLQSLHDNLLGNLGADALTQRYGTSALHDQLEALITGVDPNLLDRPYASGDEGSSGVHDAHAWDAEHGYATHASGTLTATDADSSSLTWTAGTQSGTYGTFTVDAAGHWTYVLDNDRPDTEALAAGTHGTETFTVTVTDNSNTSTASQVTITIDGTNDAPEITSSVLTAPISTQLHNVQQADATHTFEPTANLDTEIAAALGIPAGPSPDTAADMKVIVTNVQTGLGGGATFADAIAQVWDYLDENYQYYNTPVNHASVLLGLVYAEYIQNGGQPLLDTIAKFNADTNDGIADRSQSLHDNLLGNLDLPSIDDKFGADPALRDYLLHQVEDAGLSGRPIYSGDQGDNPTAAHTWDQTHGLLAVASGQLTAIDVDANHTLTWSVAGGASPYGTMMVDQAGAWHFTADDNAATRALAAGEESAPQTFTIQVADEHGAIDTIPVSIRITGTNDAPVITQTHETVVNAGFEANTSYSQFGSEGQYTNGSPSGWSVTGPSYGGWFDPTPNGAGGSTNVLTMPAENGNNVLWLNDGQVATQVVGAASLGRYELNVEVGDRTDSNLNGMPDFAVRLYAGATLIAEQIVEHTTTDGYSWTLVKIEGLVDSSLSGQPLRIEVANLEEFGNGGDFPQQVQVNFDNVTLNYVPTQILTSIDEDAVANDGQTVASILGASVTDADHGAVQGIAITHTDTSDGAWQYSSDGGAHWTDIGSHSITSALLLSGTDLVRFVPDGIHGTTAGFDYVAWDQTSGTLHDVANVTNRGGTTAFSEDTARAVITVTDVNDAPTPMADSVSLIETSATDAGSVPVNGTGNVLANDHDVDGGPLSVILVRAANASPGAQEAPQYITNGEATAHGTYGNLVIHADGSYTYTPNAAYDALPEGQQVTDVFKYGVTDGNGGDAASYLTFTITGNNDAPVIDSYVGADSVPVSVFENITGPVAHVHATDADGPLLTYSISGDDAALFHVDSSTGDLSFIAAPDYEHALDVGGNNHYNVTITASDGTLFDTQSFDVEVKDVAETYSPVTVTNDNPYYAFSDNANAPAGQPVAIHFDADDIFGGGSDTFSYTFTQVYSNTSTNWLTVDPTNGTVTGDPDHLSALTVYRIDATDAVTGHGSFTYVAFSALPDSGHYVSLTDSSSYGNASGSDVIEVAPGATPSGTISGGSASDVMIGNDEDNKFNGASESDTLYGNGGDDDLKNGSLQGFLSGGDGNDTLDAGSDPSYLLGGAGNDHLKGGHDDVLMGGDGNDTIIAGVGRNLIVGGAGNDTMTGGSGRDTYVFMESGDDNADIITNFNTTSGDTDKDVLDLSYLLDGINTDKASHVQLLYSDGSTHVLSTSPTLPATNGDVTVQVNTSGSWENVVTLTDTGSNLPPSGVTHSAIQMMLDHATIQQFHT